jgi:hypothetical protein
VIIAALVLSDEVYPWAYELQIRSYLRVRQIGRDPNKGVVFRVIFDPPDTEKPKSRSGQ